ncbi:serine hydrolase domain-containing protein [Paenibacillus protaetiae]|uniref:Class C beta-lactamase-related serine hydrolase n=1 Tax=Paenibacillus protaetiae TaxID=2509456 RepID=A0A4P6EVK3_9BACL|nr:serine hydrolase [Paenibacillus protaetiae]QAY65709.1 class C beta-lactamase-related serine hydrolase [Paenibacillus protaetiae]
MSDKTVDARLPRVSGQLAGIRDNELDKLTKLFAEWKIRSVLVIRDGMLGWEWHHDGRDSLGPLFSCTKSILSALIGIAVAEGAIGHVRQPITDYIRHAALREEHAGITIEHLLTMTPGMEWPDFDKLYRSLRDAADPMQFVLNQPIVHQPGHAFTYNSGASHLLSAILTQATGLTALDYATDKLFRPLGFRKARWTENGGVNEGAPACSCTRKIWHKSGCCI